MNKVKLPPLSLQELNVFREFLARSCSGHSGSHAEKALVGILAILYQQVINKSVFPKKETKISVPAHVACAVIHAWKHNWHRIGPHLPEFDMFMPNIIMHIDRQIL